MADVNGWKDWLLWPLRSRFGTRSAVQALPAQSQPTAEADLGWLILANTINTMNRDQRREGDETFSVAIADGRGIKHLHLKLAPSRPAPDPNARVVEMPTRRSDRPTQTPSPRR